MLFAAGKRPDHAAIGLFAAQAGAAALSVNSDQLHAAELLRDGLGFDLAGLAPGPAAPFPQLAHRFDLPDMPDAASHEAVAIMPGPHIATAARNIPVVRTMLGLACDLVRHFGDVVAVSWSPSHSAIGRRFFESVTAAWLDGGAFPALGLTAFAESGDGALASVGLDYWTGQELRIEPPLALDKVAATRLGIRLVNQLVLAGRVDLDERVIAPDGTRLVLRPSRDRATISVWRE